MGYFTREELSFYKEWALKPYDPKDKAHINAKNTLMNTVWEKTRLLVNEIVKEIMKEETKLSIKGGKYWSQRGWADIDGVKKQAAIFKHYTWYKVHRSSDEGKDVFFTFGLNTHLDAPSFVYRIDLRRTRDSRLSQEQIEVADSFIPEDAKDCTIYFEELIGLDFESLVARSANFISNNLQNYDTITKILQNRYDVSTITINQLNLTPAPSGRTTTKRYRMRSFRGVDIDFLEQNKELKTIGDNGEDLVILYEQKLLTDQGRPDLAKLVNKAKDGEGYDVLSRNADESEKYIEVKTTTGPQNKPFFLSDNELAFLSMGKDYSIYRLYNYNKKLNSADFFILSGDLKSILDFEPISYRVTLK